MKSILRDLVKLLRLSSKMKSLVPFAQIALISIQIYDIIQKTKKEIPKDE